MSAPKMGGEDLRRFDEYWRALASVERRRCLLDLLRTSDDALPVDENWSPADDRGEAMTSLHHVHLAKLDDVGLVDWRREAGVVREGPAFEDVRSLLELLDEHSEDLPQGLV